MLTAVRAELSEQLGGVKALQPLLISTVAFDLTKVCSVNSTLENGAFVSKLDLVVIFKVLL